MRGQPPREDLTARLLLAATRQTGQRFGAGVPVSVLRGARQAKLVRLGFHRLPVFGKGGKGFGKGKG